MAEDQLFNKFGREFPRGTVLFREGDTGKEMYVIQAGRVAISKQVRDVEKVLATLGPGEFFGEMAIISNKPRTATATVAEPAKCLVIDPKTFEAMVRGNAEIAIRMIKKLADRLQEADAQIENLLLRDANSRVVHYLAHSADTRGKEGPDGIRIELALNELPSVLGIPDEQLREVLQKLLKAKIVSRLGDDGVTVPSAKKLREYLEFLEMKEKFGDL
ncbi:MAG: Crp/Fnr family transcriptional regulator [Myxococcales bacterium]